MTTYLRTTAIVLAALLAAAPAAADVKAGVDAWDRGDFSAAVAEWRPLAIAGDADAQFNMGQAYKLGRGVPIEPNQALEWFRKAADQGHLQAQDNYGLGLYVANRRAEALPLLERSAARGEPRTQLVLGTMLFNGDGVKADYPRAYALMTRASQAGLRSASETLAQMDGVISPADRQRGLQLAERYAADAQAAQVAARTPPGSAPTRTAPTRTANARNAPTRTPSTRTPQPRATPTRTPPPPVVATPAPRPPVVAARSAPAGRYRVQLGAFRSRANAEALWSRVGARVGGQPAYVAAGGVTRLQATGFPTRADAQRACRASGTACVVVAP